MIDPQSPFRFSAVTLGREMQRILSVPRRPIPDPSAPEVARLAEDMTRVLASVPRPYPGRVNPTQALAIRELVTTGRLAAPIRTGGGKMLLTYLLFLTTEARRPLLLAPASMIRETRAEYLRYSADWGRGALPAGKVAMMSYQRLSAPSSAAKQEGEETIRLGILDSLQPDVILADEAHFLSNTGSIGARRMSSYLSRHPQVLFVPLTGTLLRERIVQASHLLEWSLRESAPLPVDYEERSEWASALDARDGRGARAEIGELVRLFDAEEAEEYRRSADPDEARMIVARSVGRRILETPGVIGSQDGPLGIPLSIEPFGPPREDPEIDDEMARVLDGDESAGRAQWTAPDGSLLVDGLEVSRVRRTLALGFYTRPTPPPSPGYLQARSEWASAARDRLRLNGRGIDSEAVLKVAVRDGHFPDLVRPLGEWDEARRKYTTDTGLREPLAEARWISDEAIEAVRRWIEAQGAGLIWVADIPLGERLQSDLGLPYFGAGKVCRLSGRHVTEMRRGEAAVVSISACGTGTNLQHVHHRALWMAAPSEQPLARLHRPGQVAEEGVKNWVYLPGISQAMAFWQRHADAVNFAEPVSRQAHKLGYATISLPSLAEMEGMPGPRWRRHGRVLVG
jgi:hypothetical protein